MPLVLGGLHQLVGRLVLLDGAGVVLSPLVEVAVVGMAERDAQLVADLAVELHGAAVVEPGGVDLALPLEDRPERAPELLLAR